MTAFVYQTITTEILTYAVKNWTSYVSKIGNDYRGGAIFFEGYSFEKIIAVPSENTAYANRGKYFNCALGYRFEGAQHDAWIRQWAKDFVQECRAIDEKKMIELGKEPTVLNGYANFHLPGARADEAFRENLPKLVGLKRKWDPEHRFNKWFSIPT